MESFTQVGGWWYFKNDAPAHHVHQSSPFQLLKCHIHCFIFILSPLPTHCPLRSGRSSCQQDCLCDLGQYVARVWVEGLEVQGKLHGWLLLTAKVWFHKTQCLYQWKKTTTGTMTYNEWKSARNIVHFPPLPNDKLINLSQWISSKVSGGGGGGGGGVSELLPLPTHGISPTGKTVLYFAPNAYKKTVALHEKIIIA